MEELIIKIQNNSPTANLTIKRNGIEKKKNISIEDLTSHLVSDYKLNTGLLPTGTRYFSGSNSNYNISIELPAKMRDMILSKYNASGDRVQEIVQIPYPVCSFNFSIRDCKIYNVKIVCLKHPLQSDKDAMYCFPFSNVHNDGRVCWGSVKLPSVSKPMELVGVINLFLGSEFNGDIGGHFNTREKVGNFWELINYLKTQQEFPSDLLRSSNLNLATIFNDKDF